MRRIFLLPFLLALSACNGTPIATQWKLRNFNLGASDLSQLRLALRGPDWTTPTPENASLELSYWPENDETRARNLVLRLRKGAYPSDRVELAQQGAPPSLTVIELAPQSLTAARAAQQEAMRWKTESGVRSHVRMHFGGALACRHGEIPPGPLAIDAFIHADDEIGWLPLFDQYDVRAGGSDGDAEATLRQIIPPCSEKGRASR